MTSVINVPWSVTAECIVLAAATVHSTRLSQILAQNGDFYLPHLHLMPPLGGSLLEYRYDVWYRMVWLPNGEKFGRYVYSFWQNSQTWWHRSYLHSITQQKFHIPQWWGKWTNDPESVSRTGSPPTVNHFFWLVGTIIHQVSMKSADCFCSNPAHRLTEWLTAPIT